MGIVRQLFEREFAAHSLEQWRIQAAGEREEAIRHPSLPTQQGGHGRQHRIESPIHLCCYCWRSMRPDQTATSIVVHLRRHIEEGVLEGLQVRLVKLELEFEGLIRHTPAALEHGHRLVENLLKGHRQPSLYPQDSIVHQNNRCPRAKLARQL